MTLQIAHDGSSGLEREPLRGVVEHYGAAPERCRDFTAARGGLGFAPDQFWLLVFDLQRIDEAIAVQESARAAGAELLAVGQEPGVLWIGSHLRPDQRGCLACLRTWVHNNRRQRPHWSDGSERRPASRQAQVPLSPAARQLARRLTVECLGAAMGGRPKPDLHRAMLRLEMDALKVTRHAFAAYSECPHCAPLPPDSPERAQLTFTPQLRREPGDARVPNPRLGVARARRLFVDQRTGVVKHVFHDLSSDLMPLYGAEMPIVNSDTIERGFGRAETRERSELVAILETLERFAGHSPRRTATQVRGGYARLRAELGERVVDPADFILHAPEQAREPGYRLVPYTEELELDWCWGYSMRRREPVLVPLQLVYYWLPERAGRPTNRFLFDSSNGCAMGACLEEAILYGLYEVAERDAYLATWYGRLTPDAIDLDSVDDGRVRALAARARAQGFELHLFDIRAGIDLPIVWAMIVDPAEDAAVKSYCASAAGGRWEQAAFSALVEVTTSMGVYQRTMPALREKARAMWQDGSLVQEMPDHVLLYSLPETFARLQFLFGGRMRSLRECASDVPGSRERDVTREMLGQVDKVLRVARDLIVVNQTFDGMKELGLTCVKVLAPGLLPVTFGQQYRRVCLDRLQRAAGARGRRQTFAPHDINPFPHNFP